jgi:signal transduction histidine kinase
MLFKNAPIKRKLMLVNLLTSGAVLLVTCLAFFGYELYTFRQSTLTKLKSLGEITAANSAAALAFNDVEVANEILAVLHSEQNIVTAVLYDSLGQTFATYAAGSAENHYTNNPLSVGYGYTGGFLEGTQPVVQGSKFLGTLYMKSNLTALQERFMLYGMVVLMVMGFSIVIAYILSHLLSKSISRPILALSETATAISNRQDYSVRAEKQDNDELGVLTDAFNHMLGQIQIKDQTLNQFNKNLEKKVAERTLELEISLKEQKEAERRVSEKNIELSKALQELHHTKEELINLNNELERRVESRTKEVVAREMEVNAKNQELNKVNIDLDNFIYTASHDLKSPISNLEGLVRILKEELENNGNPTVHQFLDMMNVCITKLRDTILDLAEITKVQKNLEENPELVSFEQVVEDVKEELTLTANSPFSIVQKLEIKEILYPIHGLRSVLHNLLSNAVKYRSDERPVHIIISTHRENGSVVLTVEDNGLGIEEHHLPRLFSMFKRFHSHVDGTGIGLYIIKRIVENRGGKIEYISKGNKGSIFKVFL